MAASKAFYLKIEKTSDYALLRLAKYPYFKVHSVYRKTINLSMNQELLAIQAKESPLSPVSLITNLTKEQMEQLPVREGQPVFVVKEQLVFLKSEEEPLPLFAISYKDASSMDLALTTSGIFMKGQAHSSVFVSDFSDILLRMIQQADTKGLDLVFSDSPELSDHMIMSVAKQRIDKTISYLQEKQYQSAADELIRMIGLGIGLTPSGDDFTTGVLAGIRLFDLEDHPFSLCFRKDVKDHLFDTNDVSRTFLKAALDGHFSTAVNSLNSIKKEDLGENKLKKSKELLENFLAIGHSSGIDALCGIYFVLTYLF